MVSITSTFSLLCLSTLAITLGGSACGNSPSTADAGPESVELGTGTIEFEEISDDQELTLIAGIQGGFHFIVHSKMTNLLPGDPSRPGQLGNPLTTFFIFREDGTQIDIKAPPYRLGYREDDSFYTLASGRILQIDQELVENGELADGIYGERVRLRVEIRDVQGKRAFDEVWIVVKEQVSENADAGS